MHKAEFEKSVQEKMQELRFQPSDEVWKRVERGIDDRTRKPFGYFWVVAAVLVIGIGVYFFGFNSYVSHPKYSSEKSNNNSNEPGQTIASKKSNPAEKDAPIKELIKIPSPSEKSNSNAQVADVSKDVNSNGTNSKDLNSKSANSKKIISITSVHKNVRNLNQLIGKHSVEDDQLSNIITSSKTNIIRAPRYSSPIPADRLLLLRSFNPSQQDLNTQHRAPAIPIAKRNNWEYGLSFSAGVSNLAKALLKRDSTGGFFAYNGVGPSSYAPHGASEVKNGLAFSVGGSVSRWLGAKWKVGVGLQYQYFSNTIKIGRRIDSALSISTSSQLNSTVNGYYTSTGSTTYQNQYHFISLPVTVNWQFAPQFSWENQVIYSRLIATNALHFDGGNSAYYKDRERFDNNQFIFATALKYGWNNNKFQVGPQFLYGLSNLLKPGAPTDQHLISIALKANMRLSKN